MKTKAGIFGAENSGNFLLQALLAIALIIAFMPFLARKMAEQSKNAEMTATVSQLENVSTAARIFVRENAKNIPYGVSLVVGDNFVDMLEPYGLPLGFVPRTPLGQDISLVLLRVGGDVIALVQVSGAELSDLRKRELAARIGFWAAMPGDDNSLRAADLEWTLDLTEYAFTPNPDFIYVRIPETADFSELVRRRDRDFDANKFLTNLDMNGFSMRNIGNIVSMVGEFNTGAMDTLTLVGVEDGRKLKNKFGTLMAAKASFQGTESSSALAITRGVLTADGLSARTISKYGDSGNLNADIVSVYDFALSAGRTSFTGPLNWSVNGNLVLENITLNLERLEISSFINAARGQEVYIDDDGLSVSAKTGIETENINVTNITVRDQISSSLASGGTGPVLVDVRVAGTSVLPDIWLSGVNNGDMMIIDSVSASDGDTVDCKSIIGTMAARAGVSGQVTYNNASLLQNIVCQYVFWQRLEKRIDIKKCLLEGKGNCS